MRSWPVLLLVACVACAAAGCDDGGQPAAIDEPAGKVVDLSGPVTAARAGAPPRALGLGAEVFPDDTVTTPPEGLAVILLAHNHARWSLGGGQSQRVDRSGAWSVAADQSGSSFDEQEQLVTASAGRHTDREAGDTAATAQVLDREAGGGAPPPPAQPPGAAVPPPRNEPNPARTRRGGAAGRAQLARKDQAPPDGIVSGLVPEQGEAKKAAAGAASGGSTTRATELPQAAAAPAAPPAPAARIALRGLTVKGPRPRQEVAAAFARFAARCTAAIAAPVTVTLHFDIDEGGAVHAARLIGPAQVVGPLSSCLTDAARALRFPPGKPGTTHVQRVIDLQAP